MVLDLREFETFPVRKVLKGNLEAHSIDFESVCQIKDIEVILDIQMSNEEYFCQAAIKASVDLECSRCLKVFNQIVNDNTNFIICSYDSVEKDKDIIDNEEYVYFKGTNLKVDLSDVIRQAIILAVSLKPLCSEDCMGLCPRCGINLNDNKCSCKDVRIDERWEALKKLSGQE